MYTHKRKSKKLTGNERIRFKQNITLQFETKSQNNKKGQYLKYNPKEMTYFKGTKYLLYKSLSAPQPPLTHPSSKKLNRGTLLPEGKQLLWCFINATNDDQKLLGTHVMVEKVN